MKFSYQREGILKDVQSRRDHPTANMVYESVRKEQPNISLGTVYRNLNVLVEHGLISKISTGMGSDHFDGYMEPHHHFICKECGDVIDMKYETEHDIVENVSKTFSGRIDSYELMFSGKCEKCLSKQITF